MDGEVLPLVTVVSKGMVNRLESEALAAYSTGVECKIEIEGIAPQHAFAIMNVLRAEGADFSWQPFESLDRTEEPVYCLWGSGRYMAGAQMSAHDIAREIVAHARFAGAGYASIYIHVGSGAGVAKVQDGTQPALALEG